MTDRDLFNRAKDKADIVAVYGGKLIGRGPKRRGICPLCRHGDKKQSGFAFEVDVRKKTWRAYCCDERGGSVIDLEHLMHSRGGETIVDAAKRLAAEAFPGDRPMAQDTRAPRPPVVHVPEGPTFSERFAAQIWQESRPAAGTLVQRYLLSRGIYGRVLTNACRRLRFHAHVYHSGPRQSALVMPAMIGQVTAPGPGGERVWTGGIHVTYLARDGSGKAHVPEGEKAKKMWGPQHVAGGPGGLWLSDTDGEGPLLVAEGIETALSMAVLFDGPCRAVAACSLGRLQGGYLRDAYGRFDPDMPKPDPERRGFTWPVTGEDRVIIGIDHDMSPIRVRVRKPHGGTGERILGATARARLCATLARASWEAAGWKQVSTLAPDIGEDFNDRLRRQAVQGAI